MQEEFRMAKSKLVKANQKIADTVVGCYKKIEDAFVDRYLTRDGESVEEAKMRLKAEQNKIRKCGFRYEKE